MQEVPTAMLEVKQARSSVEEISVMAYESLGQAFRDTAVGLPRAIACFESAKEFFHYS